MSISVVVPVYNTAPFLKECLDSIVDQNIGNLEILAVNDASTDGSASILKEYAKDEKRLKVINLKKNAGLGPVRNKGLKLARKKWIAFLDSDDKMQPGSLEELLRTAEQNKSHLVIGSIRKQIDLGNKQTRIETYSTSKLLNFHALNTDLDHCRNLINITHSCSIVYSRKFLLDNKVFFQRKFQEDHDFVLHAILEARKVSVRGDVPFLTYRKRQAGVGQNSITASPWDETRFSMIVEHLERVAQLLNDKKYARQIREIDSLRKTRASYYLGTFSNNILKAAFKNLERNTLLPYLDRIETAFRKLRLEDTGIDLHAESLLPTNQNLAKSGFYELCLQLILDRQWIVLEELVTNRGIKSDFAVEVLADTSISQDAKTRLGHFLDNHTSGLIKSDIPLATIIPPSIKEVYVHIGMTKTGSTAIQNFLEANDAKLKEHELIYPKLGVFHDHRKESKRTAGHNDLIGWIWKRDTVSLNKMRWEIRESGASKLILSCENLFHADPAIISGLKQIIGEIPTKVIVFLRQQDSWINSYYSESISGGNKKCADSFKDFVQNHKSQYLDYKHILETWAESFGRQNIIVKPYKKGNVIENFCQILEMGSEVGSSPMAPEKKNISPLSKEKLILLREMNKLPFKSKTNGYREFTKAYVSEFGNFEIKESVDWLSESDRLDLLREFRKSNSIVEKTYLNGEVMAIEHAPSKLSETKKHGTGDVTISAQDLERAMELYFQFCDIGDPDKRHMATSEPLRHQPHEEPKSMAAKLYWASRGVPGLEQVVNLAAPVHDRIFGVAK